MKPCRLACLALFAAAGFHAPAAQAAFYTGDDIYKVCTAERTSRDYVEKTYECIAYVTGAVDAFNTAREDAKLKRCIPADVTIDRLRMTTVDYLRDNPDARGGSAARLVLAATRKAWPCEEPKTVRPVVRKAKRRP